MLLRPIVLFAAAIALAALAPTAHAQQGVNNPALQPKDLTAAKGKIQPAALPGARPTVGGNGNAAVKSNLPPNEALFDAVNHGTIAAVRDALSRGADIEARNVLGLTPLELSVDLGHNDITFLLLSMRGSGQTRGKPGSATASAQSIPATKPAAVATARAVPPVAVVRTASPTVRPSAGNDPGIPAPQAGFLGFGTPRS